MPMDAFETDVIIGGFLSVDVALYTATPVSTDDTGTEVSGGSYARVSVTLTESSDQTSASNGSDIAFAAMPACMVTGFALFNGSDRIYYDNFSSPVTFAAGDTPKIPAGSLVAQAG